MSRAEYISRLGNESNIFVGTNNNIGIGSTIPNSKLGILGNLNVTGVVTATSFVGSGVTINSSGLNVTGVVTATSFRGDGSLLSGMSGSASVTVVTSNTALTKSVSYMISTDRSVLTLPASPSTGDAVDIYNNVAGIHTLARNGSTIMGIAEDVEFGEQGLRFKVWYTGSTWSLF